jgi:hypothetical protein
MKRRIRHFKRDGNTRFQREKQRREGLYIEVFVSFSIPRLIARIPGDDKIYRDDLFIMGEFERSASAEGLR